LLSKLDVRFDMDYHACMPVRKFVTSVLAEKMRGTHVWVYGVSETITEEQVEDALDVADDIYCHVIQRIDWNRILVEAYGRCSDAGHGDWRHICGPCLQAALLATERAWPDYGYPPAEFREIGDWPVDVNRITTYRKKK
jgi:hypothetical protein